MAERLDGERVDGLLALEWLWRGVLRELDFHVVLALAGLHALERLEDLGEEAAFLDLGPESRGGADGLLVRDDVGEGRVLRVGQRAGVVELHEVAVGDHVAFLGVLELGERAAEALHAVGHLFLADGRVALLEGKLLVLRQVEGRLHLHVRREREARLRGEQHVRHVLEVDGLLLQPRLLERLRVEGAEARLLRLVRDLLLELLLDDGKRHFPLAEPRDYALAQEHVQDLLVFALDVLSIGLDRKSYDARTRFFLLELHV